MSRRDGPLAATALALTLALAACGHHTVTRAGVIARGNAICATATRAARELPPPAPATSLTALGRYFGRAVPIVTREVAALRALPRPPEQRALLVRYLAAASAVAGDYQALAATAARGSRAGFAEAQARLRRNPAPRLAARYGLTACAEPGAAAP